MDQANYDIFATLMLSTCSRKKVKPLNLGFRVEAFILCMAQQCKSALLRLAAAGRGGILQGCSASFVRWASAIPSPIVDFWSDVEKCSEPREAERAEALKDGENLLKAFSRSLLANYKGPVTPQAAIFVLQRTRNPGEARAFFDWASRQPGFTHNGDTCSALLNVFVRARLFKDAYRLFSQDLSQHCLRSATAFSTMVEGYCYIGNMEPALYLLKEMERLGFRIDVPLHNVVLKGLCKAARFDDALNHFAKMVKNCDTDFASYSTIISSLCKSNLVDKAVDILYSMNEETCLPDVGIYNSIIEQLSKIKIDVAYMLFEQMIDRGCIPDVVTYRLLVMGYFRNGKLKEASQLLQQMVEMGCVPDVDTYNAVVDGLCKALRLEDAHQIMEEMAYKGCMPNVETHNAYLKGLCRTGRLDEAHRHVQKMIARGCSPDSCTYNTLIETLCKESKVVEAHRFFSEMVGRGCEPNSFTYNVLIAGHCKASKASASYKLLKQMLERGLAPEAKTCKSVIYLLEKARRFSEANDIAKRMSC